MLCYNFEESLKKVSDIFRDFQRFSKSFRDFQRVSEILRDFQIFSKIFNDCQDLPRNDFQTFFGLCLWARPASVGLGILGAVLLTFEALSSKSFTHRAERKQISVRSSSKLCFACISMRFAKPRCASFSEPVSTRCRL